MKEIFSIVIFVSIIICANSFSQNFRLNRPVKNNIQANGSYLYGEPNIINPAFAHTGIDYLVVYDTVYSASSGMVNIVGYNPNDTINGYEPGGAGNYIIIESYWNNKKIYLIYMHLKYPLVQQGQQVFIGQPIAISGNTGNSTGPHLHFEIRQGSVSYSTPRSRRNPELWCGMNGRGAIYGRIPNVSNNTRVDIYPDPKPRPPYTTFSYALTYNFNDPYIGSDDIYQENYAIGDVKPGVYTITALNGLYRRVVTVTANQIVNADILNYVDEEFLDEKRIVLTQNYPNPFNSETIIHIYIPEIHLKGNLKLEIINSLGQKIFESTPLKTGLNEIVFSAKSLNIQNASSILLYRLNSSSLAQTKKMIYLK